MECCGAVESPEGIYNEWNTLVYRNGPWPTPTWRLSRFSCGCLAALLADLRI